MIRTQSSSLALKLFNASLHSLCLCTIFCTILCTIAFAQKEPANAYRTLSIDAAKSIGEIRSFQGLNGIPSPVMAGLPDLVRQYKDLRVNQVRTHDVMGPTDIDAHFTQDNTLLTWLIPDDAQRAGVVKAGNAAIIFPDWSADPENPASYNFGPADKVLAAIHASGAEVYYRIGRSWGAQGEPPPDFDKYASVVKHVAMHYNRGWAAGFHYNIRYWEFWNEPEALFWFGTPEQFYSLYEKTARALKSVDPTLKVGGDAVAIASNDGPYREGLIDYCAAHHVPLDFYSWHTYAHMSADPYDAVRLAREIRGVLDTHGFPKAESILSEWNLTPDFTAPEKARLQGMETAAYIGAVLTYFQDAPLDHAQFYRGDAAWMGLFDLQGKYFKTAYAFQTMGKMQDTPQRLAVNGPDTFGFATLAGRSNDGNTIQILISNYAIPAGFKPNNMSLPPDVLKSIPLPDFTKLKSLAVRKDISYRNNAGYSLDITNLPWGKKKFTVKRYRLDATRNLELIDKKESSGSTLNMSSALAPEAIETDCVATIVNFGCGAPTHPHHPTRHQILRRIFLAGTRSLKMKNNRRWAAIHICMSAAFLFLSVAAQAEPITLKHAVELALQHANGTAIAAAEVESASAGYRELRDNYLPQLMLTSGIGPSYGYPVALAGSAPAIFNITAQSALFHPELQSFAYSAQSESVAAGFRNKDERNRIIQDTVLSYAELEKWEQRLDRLHEILPDVQKMRVAVADRVEEGIDSELDGTRARLSEARLRLRVAEAQGSADVLREHLAKLTGLPAAGLQTEGDTLARISGNGWQ